MRGFSIIEVIISLVTFFASLFVAAILSAEAIKLQASVQSRQEIRNTMAFMADLLRNTDICNEFLADENVIDMPSPQGESIPGINARIIVDKQRTIKAKGSSKKLIQLNKVLAKQSNLIIDHFYLDGFSPSFTPGGETLLQLNIVFRNTALEKFYERSIFLFVIPDLAQNIDSCFCPYNL